MRVEAIGTASAAAVSVFVAVMAAIGLLKKVDIFETFVKGARGGAALCFKILPYMVAMIFAVRVFEASGAFEYVVGALQWLTGGFIPADVLPLAIMRPFSGGASMGLLAGMLLKSGADSYAGRMASIYMGSSETLFYTVSIYLGSVGITKTRYIIPVALVTDAIGLAVSGLLCVWLYG